jgi:hypothetical protein
MLLFLVFALGTGWSQSNGGEPPADSDAQSPTPQVGPEPDSAPQMFEPFLVPDLDQSSIGTPPAPSRSYLLAGVQVSEGAESNPSLISGPSSQVSSVTNFVGTLSLLKLRHRFKTAINYAGGDTLYSSYGSLRLYNQPVQQLDVDEHFLLGRGQLTLNDSFYYVGEGKFAASSLGGSGTGAPPNAGESDFFGASQFGGVVQQAYIINASIATFTEALTPRSSAFLAGSYSIADYLGSDEDLFNSRQVSTQAGYNYQLSRKDGIGAVYGYQTFEYPQNDVGKVVANSLQFVYQRRVTGRMDFALGGGPDLTNLNGGISGKSQQITATVQASVRYRWEKSNLNLSYNRLVTAGSGYFAGGISDIATLSTDRRISRLWGATLDGGYTRVSGIGLTSSQIPGNAYKYWFAGAAVQRRLGRSLSAFASYQFNDQNFGSCGSSNRCSPAAYAQVAAIGFDWSIRPVRLE